MVTVPGVPGAKSGACIGGAGAGPVCSVVVVVCVSGGDEPHPARGKAPAKIMPQSSIRVFTRVIIMISLRFISRTSLWCVWRLLAEVAPLSLWFGLRQSGASEWQKYRHRHQQTVLPLIRLLIIFSGALLSELQTPLVYTVLTGFKTSRDRILSSGPAQKDLALLNCRHKSEKFREVRKSFSGVRDVIVF